MGWVIVMKMKQKATISIAVSLGVAVIGICWCYMVLLWVPGGLGWTPDKDVTFIRGAHTVLIVDPASVLKDKDGDVFTNWAMREFKARAKIASALWVLTTVALVVWLSASRRWNGAITSPMHPTS